MDEMDPDTGIEDGAGGDRVDTRGEQDVPGDTFGVGIHVTERELQFVVHVPSAIDSEWSDPEAFQQLVERVVWDRLDQESTLRAIASAAETDDTVTLGTVTLRPDGTVVDHALSAPTMPSGSGVDPARGEGADTTGGPNENDQRDGAREDDEPHETHHGA
jgi:hypothetical protein